MDRYTNNCTGRSGRVIADKCAAKINWNIQIASAAALFIASKFTDSSRCVTLSNLEFAFNYSFVSTDILSYEEKLLSKSDRWIPISDVRLKFLFQYYLLGYYIVSSYSISQLQLL